MSQNLSKDNSVQFWYTIWRLVIIGNLISTRQKIDGHITRVGWGSQFVRLWRAYKQSYHTYRVLL